MIILKPFFLLQKNTKKLSIIKKLGRFMEIRSLISRNMKTYCCTYSKERTNYG